MRLADILAGIQVTGGACEGNPEITGVVQDSRLVRPGHVFVAVSGSKADGWRYAVEAVKRGAAVVVSEHEASREVQWHVRVPNAREAAADLACAFHGHPGMCLRTVGVTGTNGKTTVSWMLRDILRSAGLAPGLIGTVSYEVGERAIPASRTTPDATQLQAMLAQMLKAGCMSAAMEVSSHALDQARTRGIPFEAAVFTNLTRDHLDYHGTRERYFEAKRRLFTGLSQGAAAVINAGDPWGRMLAGDPAIVARKVTYGVDCEADISARELVLRHDGSTAVIRGPWGETRLALRILGRFNVANAVGALAAAWSMGLDPALAADVLGKTVAVRGRMEEVHGEHGFKVFVDYAHTDDAVQNVLQTLRELKPRRILLVMGCGGDRDRTKRPAMGRVAGEMADHTIITSDNPRSEDPAAIALEIDAGFPESGRREIVLDRRAAIGRAVGMAGDGDIVLIAGKGHETFQEFADRTIPFDDCRVAAEMLAAAGREGAK
ncbi:MAG: UDP-N-acetylmuramoyl-L-alanyl-D-glutamate--2,6-diaminopimelate ligase [Lentisphaerae bacterium]|nr:UDP-N-acetylmuramoyl-L-alanyl-D-glutamate--2,6-diaminopimelate ligase [Lentisphaerota bacterium]